MEKEWMKKEWLKQEWLRKLFRKDNLLILVLMGVLLFVIALPTKDGGGKGGETAGGTAGNHENMPNASGQEPDDRGGAATGGAGADPDYAADLERRLTEVLENMEEVGRVKVMITLKSSSELVVEKETPLNRSMTTETDAQGGTRTVSTSEMGESVVYSTEGSSSEPYVVKSYVPEIEGVLVVAEGAGNGKVNRTVTEIVQALFGVEAHKVMVVKMGAKSE